MKLPIQKSKGPWKKGKQMADEDNPQFLFSTTNNKLLFDIINGRVDLKELAKKELKNRGLNNAGAFIGFNRGVK